MLFIYQSSSREAFFFFLPLNAKMENKQIKSIHPKIEQQIYPNKKKTLFVKNIQRFNWHTVIEVLNKMNFLIKNFRIEKP